MKPVQHQPPLTEEAVSEAVKLVGESAVSTTNCLKKKKKFPKPTPTSSLNDDFSRYIFV